MRLKLITDYGIRVLCQLSKAQTLLTATEISEQLKISRLYLAKVMMLLKQAGLVQSAQGCNGGYFLTKSPEQISIYDVVCVMEDEVDILSNLTAEDATQEKIRADDSIRECYCELQETLVEGLRSKSIAELRSGSSCDLQGQETETDGEVKTQTC